MLFPVVAGSTLLYYINKNPSRNKKNAQLVSEVKAKGFSFNHNCRKFVIVNANQAYKWAYQLGMFYKPEFGSIDDHFYRGIDPNNKCIEFFRKQFQRHVVFFCKKDLYFYLELTRYYFLGLEKAGISLELLKPRYHEMVNTSVKAFGLRPMFIGQLK